MRSTSDLDPARNLMIALLASSAVWMVIIAAVVFLV